MHVTTRIPGHKHDGLLAEKGFRGFPTLAFMDAEGNVVAQPQARTVASFGKTRDAIGTHADLTKRIEAGEEGLDAELLLAEHALGKVRGDAFKTRAEAITKATDEQKAAIATILTDEEIMQTAMNARRGGMEAAAKALLAMDEAGKRPSTQRAKQMFWGTLGSYAVESRDPALAKRAADGMKGALAADKSAGAMNYVKGFEERATKLASWKDFSKKAEGGDASAKVEVALLEMDLGYIRGADVATKAQELMESADEGQKARLTEAMVKMEFQEQLMVARQRRAGALEEAAKAILALLDAGKSPVGDQKLMVWSTIARYGMMSKNPDLLEKAADGFAATGDPRVKDAPKSLRENAAKMRAEQKPADGAGG